MQIHKHKIFKKFIYRVIIPCSTIFRKHEQRVIFGRSAVYISHLHQTYNNKEGKLSIPKGKERKGLAQVVKKM